MRLDVSKLEAHRLNTCTWEASGLRARKLSASSLVAGSVECMETGSKETGCM